MGIAMFSLQYHPIQSHLPLKMEIVSDHEVSLGPDVHALIRPRPDSNGLCRDIMYEALLLDNGCFASIAAKRDSNGFLKAGIEIRDVPKSAQVVSILLPAVTLK